MKKAYKIVLSSPITLLIAFISVVAFIFDLVSGGYANRLLFSVYHCSLLDPFAYIRFFFHVFGHASVSHLVNNMMLILLLGPAIEERFGSFRTVLIIIVVALLTGVIHFFLFPSSGLLGASGIAFAFIILTAAYNIRDKELPLTFILVTLLYLGEQIYEIIFVSDNVSQLTHILAGLVGLFFGCIWKNKGHIRRS